MQARRGRLALWHRLMSSRAFTHQGNTKHSIAGAGYPPRGRPESRLDTEPWGDACDHRPTNHAVRRPSSPTRSRRRRAERRRQLPSKAGHRAKIVDVENKAKGDGAKLYADGYAGTGAEWCVDVDRGHCSYDVGRPGRSRKNAGTRHHRRRRPGAQSIRLWHAVPCFRQSVSCG